MSLEQVFSIASMLNLLGWLLLAILPRQPIAQRVAGIALPLILSLMYLVLIVQHLQGAEGGYGSLADVALLFKKPELLLAGWLHYLAFDLFIGAWEIRDSHRHGIPHLVMIPILLLGLMLGPIGLLFYFAIRTAKTRALSIDAV
jgi:hypothetical protein